MLYILVDPRTQTAKYVGKSNNPAARFAEHFNRNNMDPLNLRPKEPWIKELYENGHFPAMKVIIEVPEQEGDEWENNMLKKLTTKG